MGAIRWRPKSSIKRVPLLLLSWRSFTHLGDGIEMEFEVIHPELAAGDQGGTLDLDPAVVEIVARKQARASRLHRLVAERSNSLISWPLASMTLGIQMFDPKQRVIRSAMLVFLLPG